MKSFYSYFSAKPEVAGSTLVTGRVSSALALWAARCGSNAEELLLIWIFLDLRSRSFFIFHALLSSFHRNEWEPANYAVSSSK